MERIRLYASVQVWKLMLSKFSNLGKVRELIIGGDSLVLQRYPYLLTASLFNVLIYIGVQKYSAGKGTSHNGEFHIPREMDGLCLFTPGPCACWELNPGPCGCWASVLIC